MKEGDVTAYIDTQLEEFRALGRDDLAEQVETVLALVAQGVCSADTCYEVFEAAKLQVRELQQQKQAWGKRKKKQRVKRKTVVVAAAVPQKQPAPKKTATTLPVRAGMLVDDEIEEMMQVAQDQLKMRILYHVLRVVENRTRALHPREKKTSDPRTELASLERSLADKERRRRLKEEHVVQPVTPVILPGDDFALSLAKPTRKRQRIPRSKPLYRRQPDDNGQAPMPKIVVDKAMLYQALIMGTQYCDREDMQLPRHLLTRFDVYWMKSQKMTTKRN